MSSLKNLQRVTYTNEMVMTLIKLYQFHGKEFYYENVLKSDANAFTREVILRDTFFLTKLFNLDVTEHRLKQVVKNDNLPRTNDEKIAANLKKLIATTCQNYSSIEYNIYLVRTLVELIFKDVKKVSFEKNTGKEKFSLLTETKNKTREEDLADLLNNFTKLSIESETESTNLICNFYIDFIHLKPFKENNDLIGLILIYVLLFKKGFTQFKYVSFFEMIFLRKEEMNRCRIEASYNWEDGFAKVEPLNQFIVKILLDNYKLVEEILKDYTFDSKLNKSNSIENTILKGPQTFTKDDIRKIHPTYSDSTINRALEKLKAEGKLNVMGTGRSARWHKVNMNSDDFDFKSSESLFNLFNQE